MSTHVIQIRDLWEMLKPHGDDCEVACGIGDTEHFIIGVCRDRQRRRVNIETTTTDRIKELEDELNEWESKLRKADALFTRLSNINDYVEQADKDEDMKPLMVDVEAFLNAD